MYVCVFNVGAQIQEKARAGARGGLARVRSWPTSPKRARLGFGLVGCELACVVWYRWALSHFCLILHLGGLFFVFCVFGLAIGAVAVRVVAWALLGRRA
jgi:hypothetical protein